MIPQNVDNGWVGFIGGFHCNVEVNFGTKPFVFDLSSCSATRTKKKMNFKITLVFVVLVLNHFILLSWCQQVPPPVPDWISKWQEGSLLWTINEPNPTSGKSATVGNGYVATAITSDSVFISGLFNGYNTSTPSHRAR